MTSCLVFFIICDICFLGVTLAIITLLAGAGVPANCGGLTRSDCQSPILPAPSVFPPLRISLNSYNPNPLPSALLSTASNSVPDGPGDQANHPSVGCSTVRFSNEGPGQKGELDKFCAFERSYYFIAIGLVFTYLITITLSILRICEKSYTKNTRVNELLSSLERAKTMTRSCS